MNKYTLSLALSAAALLVAPLSFAAGNAQQEIATATAHAQMAAAASDVATIHMHLHHVINCLVGSKDNRFDAKAGNPCNDMGSGALHDLGHAPAEHIKLERALVMSERALHADKLAAAREDATRVADALKATTQKK
ncbi:MAG: hypothetical protein ACRER7_06485 [Gammaproteobacteria bacterium]